MLVQSRSGMTLVEVLVVVGIVTVLAGLIAAGVVYARTKVTAVKCVANHHALYAAITLYTADYSGYLPLVYFGMVQDYRPGWGGIPFRIPSPPKDYYINNSLGDYITDPRTFFCPALHPPKVPLPPHVPGSPYWYSYNVFAADLRLDEIRPPLSHCEILCCNSDAKGRGGHFGGRAFRLYLDGHVRLACYGGHFPYRGRYSLEFLSEEIGQAGRWRPARFRR